VELGYELRCIHPLAFDIVYCSELGIGVFKLFSEGKTGCMVYITHLGEIEPLYLKDIQDPVSGKIPPRRVNMATQSIQAVVDNIFDYITKADYDAVRKIVERPEEYDFKKILRW